MWWYPGLRSKVVKYVALFSLEKMSSTFGMGHVNFLVTLLRALWSITKHFPPSPLGTTMMGAHQLEWLVQITFAASNFSISSFTHW